jgi:hypothetical protein
MQTVSRPSVQFLFELRLAHKSNTVATLTIRSATSNSRPTLHELQQHSQHISRQEFQSGSGNNDVRPAPGCPHGHRPKKSEKCNHLLVNKVQPAQLGGHGPRRSGLRQSERRNVSFRGPRLTFIEIACIVDDGIDQSSRDLAVIEQPFPCSICYLTLMRKHRIGWVSRGSLSALEGP